MSKLLLYFLIFLYLSNINMFAQISQNNKAFSANVEKNFLDRLDSAYNTYKSLQDTNLVKSFVGREVYYAVQDKGFRFLSNHLIVNNEDIDTTKWHPFYISDFINQGHFTLNHPFNVYVNANIAQYFNIILFPMVYFNGLRFSGANQEFCNSNVSSDIDTSHNKHLKFAQENVLTVNGRKLIPAEIKVTKIPCSDAFAYYIIDSVRIPSYPIYDTIYSWIEDYRDLNIRNKVLPYINQRIHDNSNLHFELTQYSFAPEKVKNKIGYWLQGDGIFLNLSASSKIETSTISEEEIGKYLYAGLVAWEKIISEKSENELNKSLLIANPRFHYNDVDNEVQYCGTSVLEVLTLTLLLQKGETYKYFEKLERSAKYITSKPMEFSLDVYTPILHFDSEILYDIKAKRSEVDAKNDIIFINKDKMKLLIDEAKRWLKSFNKTGRKDSLILYPYLNRCNTIELRLSFGMTITK